jgi:CRP/FNR family cyclic AMP-dependent transcriptional regulator
MTCNVELLTGITFFELLDDDERAALAAVLDHLALDAGQTLYRQGEPGDDLYVVRAGEIELSVTDITGQKIVLHVARAGDLFGALALVEDEPRPSTATALEAASLLLLDRSDLLLLFRQHPEAALAMLAALGSVTRKAGQLLQMRVSRNVNEEVEVRLTPLERVADWIAWFSGSMPFLMLNVIWFIIWIILNTVPGIYHFDKYPFGLLTMIVSLEAIFLSCFVLVSQNRQAEKDRVRSDIEYEVNVKAELEVAHLHEKADRIYESMLARFARMEKVLGAPAPNQPALSGRSELKT